MKKILIVLLCALLCCSLVGCGQPSSGQATPPEVPEASAEPTSTPTPAPTAQTLDKEVKLGQLTYSVPSSWREVQADNTSMTFYYPYEENADGYIAVATQPMDGQMTESEENLLNAFVEGIQESENVSNFSSEKMTVAGINAIKSDFEMSLDQGVYSVVSYSFIEDSKCYLFSAYTSPEGLDEPSVTFSGIIDSISIIVPEDDFLKDKETRNQLFSMANSYNFSGITDLANSYIETNSPAETDTVYQFITLAEQANAALEGCSVESDEFDDTVVAYGNGVEKITGDTNIVPYLEGYSLKVKLGFYASDWIFFEDVKIKVGEDDYVSFYFDYFNVDREVDNGISEIATTRLEEDDLAKIVNAEAPVMRFLGKDEKTRDHELTQEEMAACSAILNLSTARKNITDTINAWMDENGISKIS